MYYKKQNAQVGRLFRRGSFFDKLIHTIGTFVPIVGSIVSATDNFGSDNGLFAPKDKPQPIDELNYARNKQINGIKNIQEKPKVF